MPDPAEEHLRILARRQSTEPILAGGAFRLVADAPFGGKSIGAALLGILSLASKSLSRRTLGLPAYPYLALTASTLVVIEFRFGSTVRIKRVVGRWPIASVQVLAADPTRCRMTLRLGEKKPIEIEGVYASEGERQLVRLIGDRP